MDSTKYLLIGGGLACLEAAKAIRQHDDAGAITMVCDERHLAYNRPPLSKEYLRGEEQRDALYYQPQSLYDEQKVRCELGARVERIDVAKAQVTLAGGRVISYERLLIATGGSPVRLQVPGAELAGVHYLRTIEDAEAITFAAGKGKSAVIIGAGFIGLETAASLTLKGLAVTVVEAMPRIWPRFAGAEMAAFVQQQCEQKGVRFVTGDAVTSFEGQSSEGQGSVSRVTTASGLVLPCDLAIVGVGLKPNVELAQQAGLKVDNGIVVDERMQTSNAGVFAAGDVANYPDPVFGKRRRVEHWGHAEYSGQVAGLNMAGQETPYAMVSYAWSDIFDMHVEFAGDESEHDQAVVRGNMEERAFKVLFLKGGRLQAYFAINTDMKEFPILQQLIKRKKDLSGRTVQLGDASFALKELLK